ncbi:MAG: hypothetical protein IJD92_03175 [Bacilli bacterium]|nr:hypothetical protein [Bacilli bacterium]
MKITDDEKIERIDEIERILIEILDLDNIFSVEEKSSFFEKIIPYLQHNRNKTLLGRKPETIERQIDNYINFCKSIGLKKIEIVKSIYNFPSIIHTFNEEDFLYKYILMSVVENEDNTIRKNMIVEKPEDFKISLNVLYARYCLMKDLKYPNITWRNLIHDSHNDFVSKFVKRGYDKAYKVYKSCDMLTKEVLENMYPVDYNFILELDNLDINNFGVSDEKRNNKKF